MLDTECPVIYGAGRTGRELADYFSVRQIPVYCFIDSDNHKDNQIINGIPVKNKDTIDRLPPGTSVIAAAADADEICREILSIRKDLKVFTCVGTRIAIHLIHLQMFSFYFIRRSVYLIDKGIIPKRLITWNDARPETLSLIMVLLSVNGKIL